MNATLLTTAALLALAALAGGCGRKPPPAPAELRPVRSTVVHTSDAAAGATYAGQVMARHESKLGFQASGKVVARLVEVGSMVRRGQPLMRLDPAQESLQLASANAQVDGAQSRVDELRIDIARTEQLLARQFASQAELDRQRTALAEAQSQLESARAQREIRVNQRGYTELRADRDGVVTALHAEAGQVVSPGQAVAVVAANGEREVLVSVPESRVHELREAKVLQVSIWARPDKRYAGVLRELAPDADSVTRTYSARITVKDADAALMLGMTASVHAPEAGRAQAIRLPLAAVHNRDGQPLVWVVQDNQVSARPVKLAGTSRDGVLVASGLADGDQVVTAGAHLLHEGQRVAPTHANSADGTSVAQAGKLKP
ncbi:MAG: efflux RND transporter periplasmic adaptor subunit [Burkholderiales bacterium]|nr:efflux RND transporter periplasmic adaptor subunit [Burkholderiales bacterium]